MRALLILAALVAAFVILAPASVNAEEEETQCSLVNGVYQCGPIRVFGNVRHPSVYYVVDRSRLNVRQNHGDESFARDVVESVNETPF